MRGSAESGSARGDAVVFIHGQPGSASDFNEIIHRLPPQLETVTYDRPGWGRNPNEVTDIDGNVKYLIEDVLGSRFAKVILVGYSYGSTVALKAAVDYPQRVGGLILLAPVGSMDSISLADRLLVIALRCLEVFPYYTVLKRWQIGRGTRL
ncbi:MAG: alpha/beta hydrolase, partial [Actinomycetota bacterium]